MDPPSVGEPSAKRARLDRASMETRLQKAEEKYDDAETEYKTVVQWLQDAHEKGTIDAEQKQFWTDRMKTAQLAMQSAPDDKKYAQQMLLKSNSEAPRRFPSLPFPLSSRFPQPAYHHYLVPSSSSR